MTPPMPQAPMPISETLRPVRPSCRYLTALLLILNSLRNTRCAATGQRHGDADPGYRASPGRASAERSILHARHGMPRPYQGAPPVDACLRGHAQVSRHGPGVTAWEPALRLGFQVEVVAKLREVAPGDVRAGGRRRSGPGRAEAATQGLVDLD